jgi:hypothetical protein
MSVTNIDLFIEQNKHKPFVTNLKKYATLNILQKKKVISSFITNLYIDSEITDRNNKAYLSELIAILAKFEETGTDEFLNWLDKSISE